MRWGGKVMSAAQGRGEGQQAEGLDTPTPAEPPAKPKKAKKSVRIHFDEGSLEF